MKKTIAVLVLGAAALAAQAPASTGTTARKAATKATTAPKTIVAQPLTIPKNAVAKPDGSYAWTDKQGKKWLFVKTPFGVMKTEAVSAPASSPTLAGVKAFDAGDKVQFEKETPFGPMKWEKSKADLTDDERGLLAGQTNAKQD